MSKQRWTAASIPDLTGRTAVVTGANSGLGLATAKALATAGAEVVLAVRDTAKGAAAREEILAASAAAKVVVGQVDLASLASIRAFAEQLSRSYGSLDLLINNAGVMYTPDVLTEDGFELQLGTNYLGAFALTGLLLPLLDAAPTARVVSLGSLAHRLRARLDFEDLQSRRRFSTVAAYGRSKLAVLSFTYELQRRLAAAGSTTIAVAAHPGSADTGIVRHSRSMKALVAVARPLVTQPAAMGALPVLRAASDPTVTGGQYYGPGGMGGARGWPELAESSKDSHDPTIAARLWTESESLTGIIYLDPNRTSRTNETSTT